MDVVLSCYVYNSLPCSRRKLIYFLQRAPNLFEKRQYCSIGKQEKVPNWGSRDGKDREGKREGKKEEVLWVIHESKLNT